MRYISTRGQAPVRDFAGVLLAGLAEDGGLYVPETWPQLLARRLAGDARPAVSRARRAGDPAVRRRRDPVRHARDAVPRRLCRLRPSGGRAAGPARDRTCSCRSCSTARRSSFKDMALQLLGRLFDHVLADARCARDHRRRHLGRYRLGRDRGLRRARPRRYRHSCTRTAAPARCSAGR